MSTPAAQVARTYVAPGTVWDVARNRDHTTGAGALIPQDLGATTDRPGVWLQWVMLAGFPVAHGEVADEAAMLALHTFVMDSADNPLPRYVAPGDSCTRTDDPGWRWHCIAGHGTTLADWERRPLGGALTGLAVSGHTHTISGVTGLQTALDDKQDTFANASVLADLSAADGALTYRGTPLGGGVASYGVSARVRLTNPVSIPSATQTAIPFSQSLWDTGGFWDSGNPTVLTAHDAGIYLVGGQLIYYSGANSGLRILDILINGSAGLLNRTQLYASPDGATAINVTAMLALAAGDTVSLGAWQNSGGAVNAYAAAGLDATSMYILRSG